MQLQGQIAAAAEKGGGCAALCHSSCQRGIFLDSFENVNLFKIYDISRGWSLSNINATMRRMLFYNRCHKFLNISQN